ncbi:lipoyl domain-containing protein [bacterium]|nr:lipoyl domain-containing protein [bacterium]
MKIIIPELGEGIEKVKIVFWHAEVGDAVNKDDDLLEVTTDKASFNIPAEIAGRLVEKKFDTGDEVKVGDIIGVIR